GRYPEEREGTHDRSHLRGAYSDCSSGVPSGSTAVGMTETRRAMNPPEYEPAQLRRMTDDELGALARHQTRYFDYLYHDAATTLPLREGETAFEEAWRLCAPVLVEELARQVLEVEPDAIRARFETSQYENCYFFSGSPDLTMVDGDER